jgi:hypothetical protein
MFFPSRYRQSFYPAETITDTESGICPTS